MTVAEAQRLLADPATPLSRRLEAHAVILKASEDAYYTQFRIAEALADICIALTRVGAR